MIVWECLTKHIIFAEVKLGIRIMTWYTMLLSFGQAIWCKSIRKYRKRQQYAGSDIRSSFVTRNKTYNRLNFYACIKYQRTNHTPHWGRFNHKNVEIICRSKLWHLHCSCFPSIHLVWTNWVVCLPFTYITLSLAGYRIYMVVLRGVNTLGGRLWLYLLQWLARTAFLPQRLCLSAVGVDHATSNVNE